MPASVSGIRVTTRAGALAEVERRLATLQGVEVRGRDPESGRLVVIQSCSAGDRLRDGLLAIAALPGVVAADLVCHYLEPEIG